MLTVETWIKVLGPLLLYILYYEVSSVEITFEEEICKFKWLGLNPGLLNTGLAHHYQLLDSLTIHRGHWSARGVGRSAFHSLLPILCLCGKPGQDPGCLCALGLWSQDPGATVHDRHLWVFTQKWVSSEFLAIHTVMSSSLQMCKVPDLPMFSLLCLMELRHFHTRTYWLRAILHEVEHVMKHKCQQSSHNMHLCLMMQHS